MKKFINNTTIAMTMIAMFGALTLNAQNYTKEQKAVW